MDRRSETDEERTSRIGYEVLVYLLEHPDAQDTLQGIADWWLVERRLSEQRALVKEALRELVARGLVLEEQRKGLEVRYRINQDRQDEIRELTKNRPSQGRSTRR